MPFTNVTLVRKHLTEFSRTLKNIENLQVRFIDSDTIELPQKGIKNSSECVKAREVNQPEEEEITLGDSVVSLARSNLVPDSMVVAHDQSLTQIYKVNSDYSVNYKTGTITRQENSAIAMGQSVAVWYYYFRQYERGIDYSFNYSSGTLTRFPEGALESGQIIYLDYEIESVSFSDDSVARAIEEAHVILKNNLDEAYQNSSEEIFEIAETYLAVNILARIKSLEILQTDYIDISQKKQISDNFLATGEKYSQEADRIMRDYYKTGGSLSFPTRIRN